jgi:D-lactate dehydrogenase (cytochrome)
LALDHSLRSEGVFFPVDPGADATIGGMIATGASGSTTVRYGGMRENVLSLTFVNAAGQIVRTHSRARKSSAGYDLTRLMIGSEGTLGLICEATLRVQPLPEAMAAAQCTFPSLQTAVSCVIAVQQGGVPVVQIELADEVQIAAINRHFDTSFKVAPTLFFGFAGGSKQEVADHAAQTAEIAAECGGSDLRVAVDEGARRRLWHARHGALDATRALRPGSAPLITDVCVPLSRLAECIAAAQEEIAKEDLVASIVGHVGDGNFHVFLMLDAADPIEVARGEQFHARLVELAIACEGTCTGEHGVGYGKSQFLEAEHGESTVEVMRAIKKALDPAQIFNPGKVV